MGELEPQTGMTGEVEIDETYVGGRRRGQRGRGALGKTIVFGMLERGGRVKPQVVPNVRRYTLEPIIRENVQAGATIYTDELRSYDRLGQAGYTHETVTHGVWEFARGACHVNGLEGFWARLKSSIRGTHSGTHIWVRGCRGNTCGSTFTSLLGAITVATALV